MLAILFACAPAEAEPALPIEPPHILGDPRAPYPRGGEGPASVVLEIVVGRDGRVIDVRVVDGAAPFAAAARDAAVAWTFEPARRQEVPVPARIRFRVDFKPPLDLPRPSAEGTAAPSKAVHVVPAPMEEVRVRGIRGEAPHTELRGAEIREVPGAFGDAFRAMEAMPGVIPIVSGLPYFLIRGAPPGNTGFFLDGVPVS